MAAAATKKKKKRLQMGAAWCKVYRKRGSERGVDDGRRESNQSVDQSLQAWPLSRGALLRARSQACCHAEAFTGTQRQRGDCWHQVTSLIHPSDAATWPSSLTEPDLHADLISISSHGPPVHDMICIQLSQMHTISK